jgi:selenide,water dikinase
MEFLSSCTSGGCGAKIGPDDLSNILSELPVFPNDKLLVGYDTSDDAAVYQLNEEEAIVATMDFFSPMVENPRSFGRIAAANALSDVYAMGGEVLFALNMVCFPEKMDKAVLGEILQGGAEKLKEAGALLCGGHSIYDKEPKYGLSVTGKVNPKKILKK